jgi:ABC-type dipeptide/oligopeptide/nickel transport system permease component
MLKFVLKRMLLMIPMLIGVTMITFSIIHLAPGDPTARLVRPGVDPKVRQQIREQYHLDKPIHIQYLLWVGDLARGELGNSFAEGNRPVKEIIGVALKNTILLALFALLVDFLVGIVIGVLSAVRQYSLFDHTSTFIMLFLYSMPQYFFAYLVLYITTGEPNIYISVVFYVILLALLNFIVNALAAWSITRRDPDIENPEVNFAVVDWFRYRKSRRPRVTPTWVPILVVLVLTAVIAWNAQVGLKLPPTGMHNTGTKLAFENLEKELNMQPTGKMRKERRDELLKSYDELYWVTEQRIAGPKEIDWESDDRVLDLESRKEIRPNETRPVPESGRFANLTKIDHKYYLWVQKRVKQNPTLADSEVFWDTEGQRMVSFNQMKRELNARLQQPWKREVESNVDVYFSLGWANSSNSPLVAEALEGYNDFYWLGENSPVPAQSVNWNDQVSVIDLERGVRIDGPTSPPVQSGGEYAVLPQRKPLGYYGLSGNVGGDEDLAEEKIVWELSPPRLVSFEKLKSEIAGRLRQAPSFQQTVTLSSLGRRYLELNPKQRNLYNRAWWSLMKDAGLHYVMPVLVMGLAFAAGTARYMRGAMLEVLHSDYIRTARAKGLAERVTIFKHALKNSLIPIITLAGLSLPFLISGAVIIETVFAWPGMGREAVMAVFSRDYPVIMAVNMLACVMVMTGNLLADISYSFVDPRVRFD